MTECQPLVKFNSKLLKISLHCFQTNVIKEECDGINLARNDWLEVGVNGGEERRGNRNKRLRNIYGYFGIS